MRVILYNDRYYAGDSRSVNVSRCTNLFNVNFNDKASSIISPECVTIHEGACCQGRAKRVYTKLDDLDTIDFSDKVSSLSPCGTYEEPPPHQIRETWAGHGQLMTKVAEGVDIAIYYNDDLIRTALRTHSDYLRKLWSHAKTVYGDFGPEHGRLYAFFHAQVPKPAYKYNAIRSYFEIQSDCRNIIDLVGHYKSAWSRDLQGSDDLDVVTHEVAHIVEWSSGGVRGSPTFQLWGDSGWADIFIFDVYRSLGLTKEMERWRSKAMLNKYDLPNVDTFWFRDWFYPIYSNHGGTQLLKNYFQLLTNHFPKKDGVPWEYARDITMGEFLHFFSGAAKADLKFHATRAFKWGSRQEREFAEAKKKFPEIRY